MKRIDKTICLIHKCKLIGSGTMYGIRYACPETDCTVVCWDGKTSMPADQETRDARSKAHKAFDQLWLSELFTRKKAYKMLAKHLSVRVKNTHIGYASIEECEKIIKFARKLKANNADI